MTVFAGIDIGSATAKAVIIEGPPPRVVGLSLAPTGYDNEAAGKAVLAEALAAAGKGAGRPARVVTTGYGRRSMAGDAAVTEITCHARGVVHLVPGAASLIDVGGQDSKAVALGEGGRVLDFVMNDKCAAGTGRFLEVMARALEIPLDELGPLSLTAAGAAEISNTCTIFAESEVISQRAARRPKEEIVAGIHRAMARRIAGMARRIDLRSPLVMSGGAARNVGLVRAVELELGLPVLVPDLAQYAGALGAALLASEKT
jgi:predicted CoA-substrate-specific enzyme activase